MVLYCQMEVYFFMVHVVTVQASLHPSCCFHHLFFFPLPLSHFLISHIPTCSFSSLSSPPPLLLSSPPSPPFLFS